MSFRLRVLALIVLVVVLSTGATAWLTLRQASRQVSDAMTADQRIAASIVHGLVQYGLDHAGWDGVAGAVEAFSASTGQRIVLTTEAGSVVADSDLISGHTARARFPTPVPVDARVALVVEPVAYTPSMAKVAAVRLTQYRGDVRLVACLSAAGAVPSVRIGGDSRLNVDATIEMPQASRCAANAKAFQQDEARYYSAMSACVLPGQTRDELVDCLDRVYASSIAQFAPAPLLAYIGVGSQRAPALAAGPTAVTALVVAVSTGLCTVLLSRRVLRPIRVLTAASARLGEGDLRHRVPVAGRDELAELAHSFNRMADSLQRSEEQQRRLIGDVAHELRSPLANLRGYLEALKDGVIAPHHEVFVSLHEEALLQQRIVDDLLDLALADAGKLVYRREPVNLGQLVDACRVAHETTAAQAGVRLSVTVDAPAWVVGDADRLRQAFGNLITNAVRATGHGGTVTLRVGPAAEDPAGPMARVQVVDTGTGIATPDLPYVFDRFWRADAARGRTTGGSGLGLAIVRQIVTDHGGSISVRSSLGQGSTFTALFPLTTPGSGGE